MSGLGRYGAWLQLGLRPAIEARAAAAEVERLGYGALWINESPNNKEALAHAAILLAATSRIVVATGIAQVWARDPTAMAHGEAALGEAFPGRFLLGLGVSHADHAHHRGVQDYGRPVPVMRAYLDAMDAAPYGAPRPEPRVRRVLAALRPRMLALARERADGAHPYLTVPDHTAAARAALGPDRILAPMQIVILERDAARAREHARRRIVRYLAMENYVMSFRHQGFTDEDFQAGGSDRLVDALFAWGDAAAVARRLRAHVDAGADHVAIQPAALDGSIGTAVLEELLPALT